MTPTWNVVVQNRPDTGPPPDDVLIAQHPAFATLSARATNLFDDHGIRTIGDLVSHDLDALRALRGFGRGTLDEIQECLREAGRTLGERSPLTARAYLVSLTVTVQAATLEGATRLASHMAVRAGLSAPEIVGITGVVA